LAFGPAALAAPAFQKFWASVRPVPVKTFIVRAYEVGITQAMRSAGLRCEALWPYHELLRQAVSEGLGPLAEAEETETGRNDPLHVTRKIHALRIRDGQARRVALNPTSDLWRQLLLSGFPFIKRELLGRNPSKVQDIGDWMEVVRDALGADPEPIIRELRGILKDCPP
jgi:hypothetical protein